MAFSKLSNYLLTQPSPAKAAHGLGNPCVGANEPNRHRLPPRLPPHPFLSINSYTTPTLCHQHRNISPLRSRDLHATSPMALDRNGININSRSHSRSRSRPISHTHTQAHSRTRTCTQSVCNHMHPRTHHSHCVGRATSSSTFTCTGADNPKLTLNDMHPRQHHLQCVERATSSITFAFAFVCVLALDALQAPVSLHAT